MAEHHFKMLEDNLTCTDCEEEVLEIEEVVEQEVEIIEKEIIKEKSIKQVQETI